MGNKILFIIDEVELKYYEFNKLVTNFWLIRELILKGFELFIATKNKLYIANNRAHASVQQSFLCEQKGIALGKETKEFLVDDFYGVFFRPDPPVDIDYINACNVFEFADTSKIKFFNNPLAVRNFNEKIHVNYFPEFAPKNIVTADKKLILDFVRKYKKTIIKPLNRCYGSGVLILDANDKNINSLIDLQTEKGKTQVMVQEYLQGAEGGDKRVLIIGDKVMEECVVKLPADNDFKSVQMSASDFKKGSLTNSEKQMARVIASRLNNLGLPLVGLDVIDGKIIEINITSPCYFIKEINSLFGVEFQDKIMCEIFALMNSPMLTNEMICQN